MATFYHRDDSGAPTYATGSVLASNTMHFGAVLAILKACLVYGYGAKPAAGWSLVAESTNYLVLRNGSLSGYVCLTWQGSGSGYIEVYVSETYGGMSGNVMVGDGLKSGVAANNAAPQRVRLGPYVYNSNVHTWMVVADGKSFAINLPTYEGASAGEATGNSKPGIASSLLYVGEDSSGNFISVGGENTTGTSPGAYFGNAGGTAMKDPRTGLLVGSGSIPGVYVLDSFVTQSRPDLIPLQQASLCRAYWGFAGGIGGYLRGLASPSGLMPFYPSAAAQNLGMSGPLTSRNANTLIDLGDGHAYFASILDYRSAFRMMTDNPEFW